MSDFDSPTLVQWKDPTSRIIRWKLDEPMFARWWGALPHGDRDEFVSIYHGDLDMARFVCAFDFLSSQSGEEASSGLIAQAYATAVDGNPLDANIQLQSVRAWKHIAVQMLIDKLRYHGRRQAALRVETSYTTILEEMGRLASEPEPDGLFSDDKDIVKAAETTEKIRDRRLKRMAIVADRHKDFLKMINIEEAAERAERLKKAIAAAREQLGRPPEDDISPEALEMHFKGMIGALGHDKAKEIIQSVLGPGRE